MNSDWLIVNFEGAGSPKILAGIGYEYSFDLCKRVLICYLNTINSIIEYKKEQRFKGDTYGSPPIGIKIWFPIKIVLIQLSWPVVLGFISRSKKRADSSRTMSRPG